MIKEKRYAGADERTPSKAHYFSWISSTNEGSTEKQTLINLDYFRYLRDAFGVKLDIYALDAGNLDGSAGTYERLDGPKLRKQYPEGYRSIADKAAELGARLGVWCGPDGFGDTPESAEERRELLVGLCRDYHFVLFKCDAVCGRLSPAHTALFIDALIACRQYSPDLILLNHRLELGDGMKYATTFLWEGEETYVDALIGNPCAAPHHRAFMFRRGNTPGLQRLAEDHGVCLSSCLDYFEDELVLQAFGRDLLLAPEIYGSPWLLRDGEQAILARLFNLHRRCNDILMDGMLLDENVYGAHAVARGSADDRFVITGHAAWERRTIAVTLNEEIGLAPCSEVFFCQHHPYERVLGVFPYGETVEVTLEPFRACLLHACAKARAPLMLTGCQYRVLHEANDIPDRVEIVASDGCISRTDGEAAPLVTAVFDHTLRAPRLLGTTHACSIPNDAETLYEAAQFAVDNDSLERRSLRRAGETRIPEVRRARDAFFAQETYRLRGCDTSALFDGNPDTYVDSCNRYAAGRTFHKLGGCLRVDFGSVYQADGVRITYFEADGEPAELSCQAVPPEGTYSSDLRRWTVCRAGEPTILNSRETAKVVMRRVHNIRAFSGRRMQATYAVDGELRYLRIPRPMNRIYAVELMREGRPIRLDTEPKANNLMPDYAVRQTQGMQCLSVHVPYTDWRPGCYLAVALEGVHGVEGAYVAAKLGDRLLGCPDRATSYPANAWEVDVVASEANYTYYLPVTQDMADAEIDVYALFCDPAHPAFPCKVYLCDGKAEELGITLDLSE